jgi:hypothetical protein
MYATLEQQVDQLRLEIEDLKRKIGNQAEMLAGILIEQEQQREAKRGPGRPRKVEQEQATP